MQCAVYWSQNLLCALFLIVSGSVIAFAIVFMFLMVLAEFSLLLVHFSIADSMDFLMIFSVSSLNHSLISDGVG